MSDIVDRLQAKELVRRTADPLDRRFVRIALADRLSGRAPARSSGWGSAGGGHSEERQLIKEGLALLLRMASG
jgi:hypothetical protein